MTNISKDRPVSSQSAIEKMRAMIKPIIEKKIKPNAEMIDKTGQFPRENLLYLASEGWNSVTIPKEWGGLDFGYVGLSVAAEEIGKVDASTGLVYAMHVGA